MDDNQTVDNAVKNAGAKAQDKVTNLQDKVVNFGEDAANKVRDNIGRASDSIRDTAEDMRGMSGNLAESVAGTVREQPLTALLLVGGLGLILGFLLRR